MDRPYDRRRGWLWFLFSCFSLPTRSFFGVLENNARLQQLRADLVRAREIPVLLGRGALGDQPFHFRFRDTGFFSRWAEDVEDGIELVQEFQRGSDIANGKFVR